MRLLAAAVMDAALAAALGYLGFRFALWATPCADKSSCAPLAPVVVVCVLLGVGFYFAPAYGAWRSTPGQRLFGVEATPADNDEFE